MIIDLFSAEGNRSHESLGKAHQGRKGRKKLKGGNQLPKCVRLESLTYASSTLCQ